MHNWFQCKVKYEKNAQDGGIVKTSEAYLVDALSFTEAEERINEEMRPFISGEFLVSDIKREKVNELFANEAGDRWYRSKVNFISLDEEKGVEKVFVTLHVGAGTFLPVKTADTKDHKMHTEYCEISPEACDAVNRAKAEGRRIIAVGTTSLRLLETAADEQGVTMPAKDQPASMPPKRPALGGDDGGCGN